MSKEEKSQPAHYTPATPIVDVGRRKVRETVTMRELVKQISDDSRMSASVVDALMRSFILCVRKNLDAGKNVFLAGFGQFYFSDRKERYTYNVGDGSITYTPPISKLKFKPTKKLDKELVSNSIVMPSVPLPEGMQFGERVRAMECYKEYQRELQSLCTP